MKSIILLISSASLVSVINAIPALSTDPINVQWASGGHVYDGDSLFTLIRTTLSLSSAQMSALLQLARQLPA
jgi:hypothetical protein